MDEMLYFHVALEPHLKHSGSITGRRILFLAEVPVDVAKKSATKSEDEDALRQEAQRLAGVGAAAGGRPPAGQGVDVGQRREHGVRHGGEGFRRAKVVGGGR